jgi:hypothetical protein
MISEIIADFFGNKHHENTNSNEHILIKDDNKKQNKSSNSIPDDVSNEAFSKRYETTFWGQRIYDDRGLRVLTWSDTILYKLFNPIAIFKPPRKPYFEAEKPSPADLSYLKREANGREKERKTIASVQELEKVAQKYKKMKSQSVQNSSNENTQTQNQSKSQGLTL